MHLGLSRISIQIHYMRHRHFALILTEIGTRSPTL